MIDAAKFYEGVTTGGISFFTGVPDSLLKSFCAYVTDHAGRENDLIAANEGAAIAYASGRYLATGEIGMVYLQNSGLGNTVNPLTSLTDPAVYGIPMVLLVGWRGEPGVADEPQHVKQGQVTLELLEAIGVKATVLPDETGAAIAAAHRAVSTARETNAPQALVVRSGSFANYTLQSVADSPGYPMSREDALKEILDALPESAIVVSTTGKASREVFDHRAATGGGHAKDFLTVGCMGHASSIAHGIAEAKAERKVFLVDGDGAMLMHMGTAAVIGARKPANLTHILINNGAHESVGGQPTVGFQTDFVRIAEACGYSSAGSVCTSGDLVAAIRKAVESPDLSFLEVRVSLGAREDLGRPTVSPSENKVKFMRNLQA